MSQKNRTSSETQGFEREDNGQDTCVEDGNAHDGAHDGSPDVPVNGGNVVDDHCDLGRASTVDESFVDTGEQDWISTDAVREAASILALAALKAAKSGRSSQAKTLDAPNLPQTPRAQGVIA